MGKPLGADGAKSYTVRVTVALVEEQDQFVVLRVALVGQGALETLHPALQTFTERPVEVSEHTKYQLSSVNLTHPRWSASSGWADILCPCYDHRIRLQCMTPVLLTSPATDMQCFPNAPLLFADLLESWRQVHGPPLPTDLARYLSEGGCIVSDYRLALGLPDAEGETNAGFRGSITYTCRTQNMACIAALHALARLAFFTGLGKATRQGMGVVRVKEGREL